MKYYIYPSRWYPEGGVETGREETAGLAADGAAGLAAEGAAGLAAGVGAAAGADRDGIATSFQSAPSSTVKAINEPTFTGPLFAGTCSKINKTDQTKYIN